MSKSPEMHGSAERRFPVSQRENLSPPPPPIHENPPLRNPFAYLQTNANIPEPTLQDQLARTYARPSIEAAPPPAHHELYTLLKKQKRVK